MVVRCVAARTDWLLDQAQTAVERGRARLLASRIARFDDIKQRQDAVLAMRDQTDRTSRLLTGLRPKDDGDGPKRSAQVRRGRPLRRRGPVDASRFAEGPALRATP